MVNAANMTNEMPSSKEVSIHQALHGYSDGHRLIESSITIPNEVDRLMLRMSDLSGRNVISGFEEYITGYPLIPLQMYALAKTWYAPEMPRPGCVWTHTLLIPNSNLASPCLDIFLSCFRRPQKNNLQGTYNNSIPVPASEADAPQKVPLVDQHPFATRFLNLFYGEPTRPVLIPAKSSSEYEEMIFAFWSQQWPSLRERFSFSTGSLAARHFDGRPLDVQCVPLSLHRDVQLESQAMQEIAPVTLADSPEPVPEWSLVAADDLGMRNGGKLRTFLWSVGEQSNTRADLKSFLLVYDAIHDGMKPGSLIPLVARLFPSPCNSVRLKKTLFGVPADRSEFKATDETSLLAALGASEHHAAFDAGSLQLKKRGENVAHDYSSAQQIVEQLFRSPVTPLGGEILAGLISALDIEAAHQVTSAQPQYLAAIVEAKPSLAASARLWHLAGDRKRELFESVIRCKNIDANIVKDIVSALLDSKSDDFARRAFETWGKDAVFSALDWVQRNGGTMSDACRAALTFHVDTVMDWVESETGRTPQALRAAARVVAPYSNRILNRNTQVWYHCFDSSDRQSDENELLYLFTFLLALGLGNAPPSPQRLIKDSFEIVYQAAWNEKISDKAWEILDPIVPYLMWPNNWDKCERMRRALISAFVQHGWPPTELPQLVLDAAIRTRLLQSAKKVDGGEVFLQKLGS